MGLQSIGHTQHCAIKALEEADASCYQPGTLPRDARLSDSVWNMSSKPGGFRYYVRRTVHARQVGSVRLGYSQ